MSFVIAIPARYASSRLPGKPLLDIAGKPMIEHVYQRAMESGADEVIIATDDVRIKQRAKAFGAKVCMTSPDHHSGTDRLAEVAEQMGWGDNQIVVNLQGDEPLMPSEPLQQVAHNLGQAGDASIATLATPIHTTAELFDPHVVKVVLDAKGYALYFSRAPIPWDRDAFGVTTEELPENRIHYRHIGLYAYRVGFLNRYAASNPCELEQTESLEQLRALWSGERIHVGIVDEPPGHGVDTEADLQRVNQLLSSQ
ncbi:3-deoxy-manno-octulosonate cytidylyltransferase [Solemya pervernicosa gill symbiont]|uniref:3-deoxy-manno-octulosonate cytidylyltransferase n=2 Tax=Gammaproteobacteria incertae sedis TaxID=118884 RepID=A0A1T2LAT9_9GAMM|nr:3-deoxy-manno-octulosonate cytidylyltransferase [Candidatus Reidiella endopervernicosa]OOZ42066.1 3-deoxy-manno-octulosonate cytidylyltransferase [Solemya pervernicosa gill symbiont]QKQ26981.1 3-deoxy-manno-octulosonate cytidylyltransferase [Candidatus Reidiella endopervernicosa]